VEIVRVKEGVMQSINKERVQEKNSLSSGDRLSASISGSFVSCQLNNLSVVSAEVPGISSKGGVGLRVEDFYSGASEASFTGINVYP
jgi:hypothetical protein